MWKTAFFLCIVFSLHMSPVVESAVVSQHFGNEGSLVSEKKKSPYMPSPGTFRYSIPEGIELHKDITYEYYPVFGKTFSEIVTSVEENGPFNREKNRRSTSKFEWGVGWSYQFEFTYVIDEETKLVDVALEISDINIRYDITITLPTLIDDTSLNPIEKSLWKAYFQRLLEHEHDHAKIIQDAEAKNTVLASIKGLNYLTFDFRTDINIEKTIGLFLREETAKLGQEWVRRLKDRLGDYDRVTDYGNKHDLRQSFFK